MERNVLEKKFSAILPLLDERQKRIFLAAEAQAIGRGGVTLVSSVSGVARSVIHDGINELEGGTVATDRIRRPGAGRRNKEDVDPTLREDLDRLVSPDTRGDPMSPLRWTLKSTRRLAAALEEMGHKVSHARVGSLLNDMGYSLQAPAKVKEGGNHEDRNAQFNHINEQVKSQQLKQQPVLSIDTKKKELVGEFKNGGKEFQPKGQPVPVNVHDFANKELGKANPYGLYDPIRNEGWVNVGTDHDTAAFAVESIRRWYNSDARKDAYPNVSELLLCADGGGSNGSRVRLWKRELARLSAETGIVISVCHLPPGTSKWNKIEHRMFSFISMNWRGRPLTSHEVIVDLIAATTTRTGLKVRATLDRNEYPSGIKVSDEEMLALEKVIKRNEFHGDWNYSIYPSESSRKLIV